jgi:hypothetical protein
MHYGADDGRGADEAVQVRALFGTLLAPEDFFTVRPHSDPLVRDLHR